MVGDEACDDNTRALMATLTNPECLGGTGNEYSHTGKRIDLSNNIKGRYTASSAVESLADPVQTMMIHAAWLSLLLLSYLQMVAKGISVQ